MASEIRLGQLIAPFGPGSIYTDKNGVPNIVCGLDFWYKKPDGHGQWQVGEAAMHKHVIDEPRLSALLCVSHFRLPPQYGFDEQNPELSKLQVQTHRFPTWYVDSTTRKLRRFSLNTVKLASPENGPARWRPVRFIMVCAHGHIADFPWKPWCGCTCPGNEGLELHDSGGPDLRSVRISCKTCMKSKTLAGAMSVEREPATGKIDKSGLTKAGIQCSGERPWLGSATERCSEAPVGVLVNQSNIYFGRTISSIYLPDLTSEREIVDIQEILREQAQHLTAAKVFYDMNMRSNALQLLQSILQPHYNNALPADEAIFAAFESLNQGAPVANGIAEPTGKESDTLTFRRAEYNVLRNEVQAGKSKELRVVPSEVPAAFNGWLDAINLVERLRETRVFYGFDRLVRSPDPLQSVPSSAMKQLFLHPPEPLHQWLPAVKNYGEGLYFELREEMITSWLEKNAPWLQARLDPVFVNRMAAETMLMPPSPSACTWRWAARYLLVHTLAHIVIGQLVFECGYSSASLKERLFVSNDTAAPMAAFLVYTAAGDSEGSLGGLVRLGRKELLEPMMRRAISRASWCSADPVCSEDLGGTGSRLVNKAACHACVLLPETACETINSGLDRAMIVGTPQEPQVGFLSHLVQGFAV
ncbi:DUF1998 domain-containing protein [Cupriavidus alkaliphilus]|uniref:MrfA-like Zn-binding domain-containing protein n=1 Tax=Cupriavidus alkaliphilus TaxID=942866 RepID=A0A7W4VEQ6_9BURK|nr:DUF1998 domain-containing protein [Cupriavidus alkaliphilus]MBB3010250.1 hypothetical protein [Cupriavidus alkaliphilus]